MPIYEYKCKCKHCHHKFDRIVPWMKRHGMRCPRCGGNTQRLVSRLGAALTDKSFLYTGRVDKRVGGPPIKGRKDWHKRMAAKGLVPLTKHDIANEPDGPKMEPISFDGVKDG